MSGLIKAGGDPLAFAVRPLSTAEPVPPEEAMRLERRVAQLEQQLAARDAQLLELKAQAQADARDAYEAGQAAGLAEAQDSAAAAITLLGKSADAAQGAFEHFLAGTERLAILLARECLTRMLGEIEDMAGVVERLVRHQIQAIDGSTLLAVTVSSHDFDEAALERMRARFAGRVPAFRRREDVPSGACSFALTLGEIDLGLPQQWGAILSLLGELTGEEGA